MFLTPYDFEDEPMKKSEWGFIIGFVVAVIGFVCLMAYLSSLSKPPLFKMITPYGNSYYQGESNRPYLQYQARFMKGDTEIYIVGGKVYKIIQLTK